MSGFGAIGGMNTTLSNNAKLLRKRKPLEGLRECSKYKTTPLYFRKPTKEYILQLKKKLKIEHSSNILKNLFSMFITIIIIGGIIYYLPIVW